MITARLGELRRGAQPQVIAGPLALVGVESLEAFFESIVAQLTSQSEMGTGNPVPQTVGSEDGVMVAFEGTPQGGAVLQTMVSSVQFTEQLQHQHRSQMLHGTPGPLISEKQVTN